MRTMGAAGVEPGLARASGTRIALLGRSHSGVEVRADLAGYLLAAVEVVMATSTVLRHDDGCRTHPRRPM